MERGASLLDHGSQLYAVLRMVHIGPAGIRFDALVGFDPAKLKAQAAMNGAIAAALAGPGSDDADNPQLMLALPEDIAALVLPKPGKPQTPPPRDDGGTGFKPGSWRDSDPYRSAPPRQCCPNCGAQL